MPAKIKKLQKTDPGYYGFEPVVKVNVNGTVLTLRRPPGKRTLNVEQINELVYGRAKK